MNGGGYSTGYSAGRADGMAEMRVEIAAKAARRSHADDCGCGPCGTVREVWSGALGAPTPCSHADDCGCMECVLRTALYAAISHAASCGCIPCLLGVMHDMGRDTLETEIVASTRHAPGCGCQVCALLRAVWTLTPAPDDAQSYRSR